MSTVRQAAPPAAEVGAPPFGVAVAGWALHVPRPPAGCALPLTADERTAVPAERAHELLGRGGLLAKEPATRLALCAVHRALGLVRGARPAARPLDTRTAVVASSNFGNAETVVDVTRTVREASVGAVSPLDVPNASSNVVASTVAIRFGLAGPNLMVCCGRAGGIEAIALATLVLRADRADRAIVVGAEPDDRVATALRTRHGGIRPRAGAAAVVLERGDPAAPADGVPRLGALRTVRGRAAARAACAEEGAGLLLAPAELHAGREDAFDVEAQLGELDGALGVVAVAIAAAHVASAPGARALVACPREDGAWDLLPVVAARAREERP